MTCLKRAGGEPADPQIDAAGVRSPDAGTAKRKAGVLAVRVLAGAGLCDDGAVEPVVPQPAGTTNTDASTRPASTRRTGAVVNGPRALTCRRIGGRPTADNVRGARCVAIGPAPAGGYLRMFTARLNTSPTVISDASDCTSISILAHVVMGIVSVGLNAVALVNERYR